MQIVAGNCYDRRVYYEAPPSSRIEREMRRFIQWFNGSKDMNALERALGARLGGFGRQGRFVQNGRISAYAVFFEF